MRQTGRKAIAVLSALFLILGLTAGRVAAESAEPDYLNQPLADFTVETIGGGSFTLSEALKEKELVIINLWATWCPPCAMEFPYLQEAFEQYQDRVAVIALSLDPSDTPEMLKAYAEARGLTFPVGSDRGIGLAEYFQVMYIPTTVAVDRNGYAVLAEAGAQPSAEAFTSMFDSFLGEGYAPSYPMDEEAGSARWEIRFQDRDGNPVAGCMINFCTDTACYTAVSDENGLAVYEGDPGEYHLQVLKVPEGYAYDTNREFSAGRRGGSVTIEVSREE